MPRFYFQIRAGRPQLCCGYFCNDAEMSVKENSAIVGQESLTPAQIVRSQGDLTYSD